MSAQPDLFSQVDVHRKGLLSESPIARSSDPVTSKIAAREVTESGQRGTEQQRVLGMLHARPGSTGSELARAFYADAYAVRKRLPELRDAGFVRNGEKRRCGVTGKLVQTWYPTGKVSNGPE